MISNQSKSIWDAKSESHNPKKKKEKYAKSSKYISSISDKMNPTNNLKNKKEYLELFVEAY